MKQHNYLCNEEEKLRIDDLVSKNELKFVNSWKPLVLNEKDITMEKSNYLSLTKHNSEYVASTKSFGHYIWKKYEKMDVVPYDVHTNTPKQTYTYFSFNFIDEI